MLRQRAYKRMLEQCYHHEEDCNICHHDTDDRQNPTQQRRRPKQSEHINLLRKQQQKKRRPLSRDNASSSISAFSCRTMMISPMSQKNFKTVLLWLLLFFWRKTDNRFLVVADQSAVYASNAKSRSANETKKGMLEVTDTCRKNNRHSEILVDAVYMVCDSPGAYYRGSPTYRNSLTCIYGDKARVNVEFTISKDFTGASSITFMMESGIYDLWSYASSIEGLCSYRGLIRMNDDNYTCPYPGNYELYTYFKVPAFNDVDLHYTPDVKFQFLSMKGRLLGCGTTGTHAMNRNAKAKQKVGMVLMGAFLIMFLCIFGCLLLLSYRRKKRLEQEIENRRMRGFHYYPSPDDITSSAGTGGIGSSRRKDGGSIATTGSTTVGSGSRLD